MRELEYELLFYFSPTISSQKIIIDTNNKSTRVIDSILEKSCLDYWDSLKKKAQEDNKKLWDSEIYRFESCRMKDKSLYLKISSMPFSIRLGMNNYTDVVKNLGINYASLGMFTSCFVMTSDRRYLFIEKSNKYHTNRKISFIGGILSKTEMILNSGDDLFNEVIKEITEEIGIYPEYIEDIGLDAGYITGNYNFCLIFTVHLNKSTKEVEDIFKGNNDGEASRIINVGEVNLKEFALVNLPERDFPKFEIMNF